MLINCYSSQSVLEGFSQVLTAPWCSLVCMERGHTTARCNPSTNPLQVISSWHQGQHGARLFQLFAYTWTWCGLVVLIMSIFIPRWVLAVCTFMHRAF